MNEEGTGFESPWRGIGTGLGGLQWSWGSWGLRRALGPGGAIKVMCELQGGCVFPEEYGRGAEGRCWRLGLLEIILEFLGAHPVAKVAPSVYLWTHFTLRGHTAFLGLSGSNSGSLGKDFKNSFVNSEINHLQQRAAPNFRGLPVCTAAGVLFNTCIL